MNWLATVLILLFVCSFSSLPASAATSFPSPCGANVVFSGSKIIVYPEENGTSTAILECALNEAKNSGINSIKLRPGDFIVNHIEIDDFDGEISGSGRNRSRIIAEESARDCSTANTASWKNAMFVFRRSAITLRALSVEETNPCQRGKDHTAFVFTGQPADAPCELDTTFIEFNRVDFRSDFVEGVGNSTAIHVAAEGNRLFRSCLGILAGSFTFFRGSIDGFHKGIVTSLRSYSDFDVRFSEFRRNTHSIELVESSQDTRITQNTFVLGKPPGDEGRGGWIAVNLPWRLIVSQAADDLMISRNVFKAFGSGIAIYSGVSRLQEPDDRDQRIYLVENLFEVDPDTPVNSPRFVDLDARKGVFVSGNTITGPIEIAMVIEDSRGKESEGWIIERNDFNNGRIAYPFFEFNTQSGENYVAPNQNTIEDRSQFSGPITGVGNK